MFINLILTVLIGALQSKKNVLILLKNISNNFHVLRVLSDQPLDPACFRPWPGPVRRLVAAPGENLLVNGY